MIRSTSLDGGQNEKVCVFTNVIIKTLNDSMIKHKFQYNRKNEVVIKYVGRMAV